MITTEEDKQVHERTMDQELTITSAYTLNTLRVHSSDVSTFLREMTLWPPSANYDIIYL